MGIEIERKFLVASDDWRAGVSRSTRFSQGYLSRDPARTVRVRLAGEQAFLTIKGATLGAARAEFEYAVPVADARALLAICDGPVVEKVRSLCPYEGMTWEVDEFLGANAGLVLAEIELDAEDQPFVRPPWLGAEVTGDARFVNANLAVRPFTSW
ncbi:MAG: CYTH domain-containing protein [Proteobacteria bacterium]|jgi:adenylate cyclase|nr:adenylate cyclase [Methylibium sp.]MBY0368812.1 CYTH domain-containing protein [Burkholderiaceae bacterium]MCH8855065.1 CYTH domain-containing protein [Pseudomonadota bacterium]|mmetsp:Transcript_1039/g.2709  ORF Transcript_1039/g.2709 Transcript_1039/m.2709 type:complete len:155 (-) Transcript_1039:730-1194(-)